MGNKYASVAAEILSIKLGIQAISLMGEKQFHPYGDNTASDFDRDAYVEDLCERAKKLRLADVPDEFVMPLTT